jgi:hypothetical protein
MDSIIFRNRMERKLKRCSGADGIFKGSFAGRRFLYAV